jgi:hypothetical protein
MEGMELEKVWTYMREQKALSTHLVRYPTWVSRMEEMGREGFIIVLYCNHKCH